MGNLFCGQLTGVSLFQFGILYAKDTFDEPDLSSNCAQFTSICGKIIRIISSQKQKFRTTEFTLEISTLALLQNQHVHQTEDKVTARQTSRPTDPFSVEQKQRANSEAHKPGLKSKALMKQTLTTNYYTPDLLQPEGFWQTGQLTKTTNGRKAIALHRADICRFEETFIEVQV